MARHRISQEPPPGVHLWPEELSEPEFFAAIRDAKLASQLLHHLPFDQWAKTSKGNLTEKEIREQIWFIFKDRYPEDKHDKAWDEWALDNINECAAAVLGHIQYRERNPKRRVFESEDLFIIPPVFMDFLPLFYSVRFRDTKENSHKATKLASAGFEVVEHTPRLLLRKHIKKKLYCSIRYYELRVDSPHIDERMLYEAFGPLGLKVLFAILRGLEANAAKSPGYIAGYFEDSKQKMLQRMNLPGRGNGQKLENILEVFRSVSIQPFYRGAKARRSRRIIYPRHHLYSIDALAWFGARVADSETNAVLPREITEVSNPANTEERLLARVSALTFLWHKKPTGIRIRLQILADWLEESSESDNHGMHVCKRLAHGLFDLTRQGYIGQCRIAQRPFLRGGWLYFPFEPDQVEKDTWLFIEPPDWFKSARHQKRSFTPDPNDKDPLIGLHVLPLLREAGLENPEAVVNLSRKQLRFRQTNGVSVPEENGTLLLSKIRQLGAQENSSPDLFKRWPAPDALERRR